MSLSELSLPKRLLGGVAGLALALWVSPLFATLIPESLRSQLMLGGPQIIGPVAGGAMLFAFVSALVFGIIAAMRGQTDGIGSAVPGTSVTYTIVGANAGPSDAPDAQVTDSLPGAITGATWTCTGTGGASCRWRSSRRGRARPI